MHDFSMEKKKTDPDAAIDSSPDFDIEDIFLWNTFLKFFMF